MICNLVPTGRETMSEESKAIGRRFFEEQDRLRGGPADELCASTYTFHIAGMAPMNLEGHKQFASMFYSAFPDLQHIIEDTVAEGDKAVVHLTLHGTHKGDFMGIPPTGKEVRVSAIAIFQIADGKVTRIFGVIDQAGMMRSSARCRPTKGSSSVATWQHWCRIRRRRRPRVWPTARRVASG
jgi:steroid delta-isomerase-like uncharacterized protein